MTDSKSSALFIVVSSSFVILLVNGSEFSNDTYVTGAITAVI